MLAKELDCSLVAEGVETAEELATLRSIGVGAAQGFFLGRPQRLPMAPLGYAPHRVAIDIRSVEEHVPAIVGDLQRSMSVIRAASTALHKQPEGVGAEFRRLQCDRITAEVAFMANTLSALGSHYAELLEQTSPRDVLA